MHTTTRALLGCIGLLGFAAALGGACSASNDASSGSGSDAGSPSSSSSGSGGGGVGGSGGSTFTTGSGSGTGGFGGSCAAVSSEAQSQVQPADIIIAVDTSGSMDEEAAEVQQNLNNFASLILAANIDVHVVLIADATVCIPAPLGSGQCNGADESLPAYRHLVQTVNSTDALQQILTTYPLWKDSLRPGASKTIAVVSDDDSDLSAADFTGQLLALDPPTFQGFKFDAIVSSQDPDACTLGCFANSCQNCGVCCPSCMPLSAAEGTVYKQLVQQTTGVMGDLCQQDFDPVFTNMATAVVTSSGISCEYDIPPNPDGSPLETTKVNVQYTSGSGSSHTIGFVAGGAAACGQQTGGWYYDDPQTPTQIILCPSTCSAVQTDMAGKVEVLFGCDTVPAIPE